MTKQFRRLLIVGLIVWLMLIFLLLLSRNMGPKNVQPAPTPAPAPVPALATIPAFEPWPPPRPSARTDLPREAFRSATGVTTLGSVSDILKSALRDAGYLEYGFYSVPKGFALATKLERIEEDGRPAPPSERWTTGNELRSLELGEVLQRLAGAPPGRFRVILFVVTTEAFRVGGEEVTRTEALGWVTDGANKLPRQYFEIVTASDTDCSVLIYEFEVLPVDKTGKQVTRLDVRQHLDGSGLTAALGLTW